MTNPRNRRNRQLARLSVAVVDHDGRDRYVTASVDISDSTLPEACADMTAEWAVGYPM